MMGYICNNSILIDVSDDGDDAALESFRAALPEEWQPLMVGPIRSLANGAHQWALMPHGSKDGWNVANRGEEIHADLIELLSTLRLCYWVEVAWGHDHGAEHGPTITGYGPDDDRSDR